MQPPIAPIAPIAVTPGQVLGGKFRVEKLIGAGGMGMVVAATNMLLNKRVALKFLLPSVVKQPGVVERFLREARNAAHLRSEHAIEVLDVGVFDDSTPFMVMELLDGHDLADTIRMSGPMPVDVAVDHVLQACEAVAEAHSLGIVHRDIKPANLFLTTGLDGLPLVKVLDFGLSKATSPSHSSLAQQALTHHNAMLGSPLYMSPEQVKSSSTVDGRSDIWSLGVTLFEMLTGAVPFKGDSITALAVSICTQPPLSPCSLRPDLPPALEAVLLRCLEKEPSARYQTVAELAEALAPFGQADAAAIVERVQVIAGRLPRERSSKARKLPLPPGASAALASSPVPISISQQTSGQGPRNGALAAGAASRPPSKAPLVVVMVVSLALGGALAFALLGRKPDSPSAEPASSALPSAEASVTAAPPVVPVEVTASAAPSASAPPPAASNARPPSRPQTQPPAAQPPKKKAGIRDYAYP